MKKFFSYYAICWVILVAAFHVAVFVVADNISLMSNGSFWPGYLVIMVSFISQLACAYLAFKEENRQRLFYHLSLITISYSGLLISLVVGILCMVLPGFPTWIGVVVCVLVAAFNALALIKAKAAIELVSRVDDQVAEKTQFIKSLTAEAAALTAKAKSEPAKTQAEKVYEAIRYSDPMSSPKLSKIESEITQAFAAFRQAVTEEADTVTGTARDLLVLIQQRNQACKLYK